MASRKRRFTAAQAAEMLLDDSNSDTDNDTDIDDSDDDEDVLYEIGDIAMSSDESDSDVSEDGADDSESPTDGEQWTKWQSTHVVKQLPFTVQNPGVQIMGTAIPVSAGDSFDLFFTTDLVQDMVNETNRYANEKLSNLDLKTRSIWHTWKDVTVTEFRAYLGVVLRMAMQGRGGIKDFFSSEWINHMPFFGDVFRRERFLQIHWMLHVQPPSNNAAGVQTRGSKVKNVTEHMKNKCFELFVPYKNIVIDESTISFKGRTQFKMYNPQKPHKWGLRVFSLADCKTGYLCAFEPYYGSITTNSLPRSDLPFTARIVIHLCYELKQLVNGDGYHLFTDRYYTGHCLAQELLKANINTTGTVMRNRQGLPQDVKQTLKMKKFEVRAWNYNNNEMMLAWQDKRIIFMLSTYYNADTETLQRTNRDKQVEDVIKPTAIVEYTKHMGAVDRFDHYCSSYSFTRKSLKWWRKTFYWLLEVAVVNSFIIFNETHPDNQMDHIGYRKAVILHLVHEQRATRLTRRRGRPSTLDAEERLNKQKHFIAVFDNKKTKDCSVCSDRKTPGGRRKTVYYCETCSRHPGLHPGECFKNYHTMCKYK